MNSEAVAKSYDQITKSHDSEKTNEAESQPYRHFNNFVKKALIGEVVAYYTKSVLQKAPPRPTTSDGPTQLDVLDIASGRGGDLKKWAFLNRIGRDSGKLPVIGTIYGVDISSNCVSTATQRYDELKQVASSPISQAVYEVADTFSQTFWESLHLRQQAGALPTFDLASCFFAFHYGCRSKDSVRAVLQGIANSLRPGGIFFGTIVDAEELSLRLNAANNIRNPKLCNPLFRVSLTGLADDSSDEAVRAFLAPLLDETSTLRLGTNYYFRLEGHVDADEFVIPYKDLCDIAATCGLNPVPSLSKPFGEMIMAWHGDKTKMRIFGNNGDLSQDERNLVSLYRNVCFQKRAAEN